MEFMSRGTRPNQSNTQTGPAPAGGTSPGSGSGSHSKSKKSLNIFNLGSIVLLFSIAILVLAVLGSIFFSGTVSEFKSVDKSKLQAVFLNGGQVYFGRITNLNENFMKVKDIYYLRIDQQVQPDKNGTQQQGTPILVKLGCELHRPQNEMVINREQIIFWENLKDETAENTVPGAVKKYAQTNPDGQKCEEAAQNTNTNTNATTPTAPTPAPATPTPTPTTPRR